ncbi:hypothetical protein BZA05DRAFT_51672 [Tricharina praecox]|uniref:uncharacterized protein n=1 Tax=Tricharina praecox TaxID=43433 RepID=UPI00221F7943|nr:uncharacterized protein BZA05DRAFT_51672 [Tricharina praecox]KAI5850863.1 hypothetical protein BZA05DRAFT_51672 [Tricharina praecox]
MAECRFQLAALQITFLCEMGTQRDVRCSLMALPDTLTTAYDEIYKRIETQKGSAPQLAINAFRWIQCSYEPLRTETLLDAITVELDGSGGVLHYPVQANDLLKACQGFIILDERLDVFRFAHLSVEEYLETQLVKFNSHVEILKVCLLLLCASSWGEYDETLETRQADYNARHLLLYSVVFSPWHFAQCEDKDNCQAVTGLWNTFVSGSNYQRWANYHQRCVQVDRHSRDIFWCRTHAVRQAGDDTLSSVCVFGYNGGSLTSPSPRRRLFYPDYFSTRLVLEMWK